LALAVTPAWPADDVAAIRNVTTSHLDNTNSHVDVGPLVIVGDHALADWVQGHSRGYIENEAGEKVRLKI
jgi:hypothetical protein